MRALKCLRNIEIIRKKHEMAVAKQQSEAWRKALDGVPDSLRMLLEINNTENVPEYSEKQKKQYNDAIKAYEHTGNGVSWSQFEWKTYDTQMTVTFEDSVPYRSENLYKQLEEKEKLRREVCYLEEKAKGRTGKPQKKQL